MYQTILKVLFGIKSAVIHKVVNNVYTICTLCTIFRNVTGRSSARGYSGKKLIIIIVKNAEKSKCFARYGQNFNNFSRLSGKGLKFFEKYDIIKSV